MDMGAHTIHRELSLDLSLGVVWWPRACSFVLLVTDVVGVEASDEFRRGRISRALLIANGLQQVRRRERRLEWRLLRLVGFGRECGSGGRPRQAGQERATGAVTQ